MIEFFDWKFYFSDEFKIYLDQENKRFALLTRGDDEIHITIEVVDNQLVFNPRWSIKIVFVGEKEIRLVSND